MIWVCRAGVKSKYMEYILETKRIYLPWSGFRENLSGYKDIADIRKLVLKEKGDVSKTSISNWSSQIHIFCQQIKVGDIIVIPYYKSRKYCIAKASSGYTYDESDKEGLWHSIKISILVKSIDRERFSKNMQYSLGAFRTVFRIKNEEEFLATINKEIGATENDGF